MATALAGAVLTIITGTVNIFGGATINIAPTFFTSMESCKSYVKSQELTKFTGWDITNIDTPENYTYSATKNNFINGIVITFECKPQH